MRGVFVLTVALFAGSLHADEATLSDGRRLKGTLGFAEDRLHFLPPTGRPFPSPRSTTFVFLRPQLPRFWGVPFIKFDSEMVSG